MLYDIFTGNLSIADALIEIASLLGKSVFPDFSAAIDFFTNFVNNIRVGIGGNVSVANIVRILPDFASMLVSIIPGASVAKVLANLWNIGSLL